MTEKRATWTSRVGFIFAAAGSAVGLANIWRFPYILGMHGGAAFLIVYLICLFLIGFPVFISELLIGRTTGTTPGFAFEALSGKKPWRYFGNFTILTGFIVSAFYSAVAGWILGYLVEAFRGNLTRFEAAAEAQSHFSTLLADPYWGLISFAVFLFASTLVLFFGVREGIERGNKIMMPALFVILILILARALTLPNAWSGVEFLLAPDFSALTPTALMIALGQSFFTLSLGQGTMVTYGSYLAKKDNLVQSGLTVVLMDTLVSLFAAVAVFAIVFFAGLSPDSGPGLLFHTLPLVFGKLPWGDAFACLFFFLVFLAALTSQISAMEPAIAYLIDRFGWGRKKATFVVAMAVFIVGIPCALSNSVLRDVLIFGMVPLDFMSFVASSIMIPVGGFFAVMLVGYWWGMDKAINQLKIGAESYFAIWPLAGYFKVCIKVLAPLLIILVFLSALL